MLVAGYSLLVLAGQAIIVAVRKSNTIITPNIPFFKNAIHYIYMPVADLGGGSGGHCHP